MSDTPPAETESEEPAPDDAIAIEHDYESITSLLDDDPERAHDDEVITALAMSKVNGTKLWSQFAPEMSEYETIDYNAYQKLVASRADELKQEEESDTTFEETTPDAPPEPESNPPNWETVAEAAEEMFDERSRHLADAFMTVPGRMLFSKVTDCPIVIGVGAPSSGKSTIAETFGGINFVNSYGKVTPNAWISHNADAEKGEYDLLPRIKQRVMLATEISTWFTGDNVEEYMRVLAAVADGNGDSKTTGAHGTTRYEADYAGEYRFGLIGATVYPTKRAWIEMGHAGSRFLFHPLPKEDDLGTLVEQLNDGNYAERKQELQEMITQWWRGFYHQYDGEIAEDERPSLTDEEDMTVACLARIISRGRAVDFGGDHGQSGVDMSEQESRAFWMLKRMLQMRALAYERDELTQADMAMAARVTFASIPQWRKPIVKMLCNPDHSGGYRADDVESHTGYARSTALDRMKEAGRIGIANYHEEEGDSGRNAVVTLADKKLQGVFQDGDRVPWPFEE
ncbi:hypothetical protein [Haloplanus salinarum]|uniref:hypothetical protein n=1 Tax=Haloplanus salinarum TaxID=1912324 RepID=UPI00214AEF15|nr:hypothetical protein [Haloplanus salinarum]